MSVLDKFLDAIRLNDDYDDDDEFFDDDDIEEDEAPKPKKRFFKKMAADDDYLDDDDEDYKPAKKSASKAASAPVKSSRQPKVSVTSSKVTPMRKRSGNNGMEVCVIKPSSMEDTREIADTLLANCTVVLNLEGIDVEVAQRIIDFSSGACYAINGSLQKVSSYIFILTPARVEISGDIQDILNGAVPSISTEF